MKVRDNNKIRTTSQFIVWPLEHFYSLAFSETVYYKIPINNIKTPLICIYLNENPIRFYKRKLK